MEPEKQEITVWKPSAFVGTDCLPLALADQPAAQGELVGRENVEAEDLILPTLRLLQGQSQAVTEVEGAAPGLFYHSTTQQVFKPPLRLLIVAHMKGNALFPKPEDPRSAGLETCISRDGVRGTVYGFCEECRKCLDWDDRRPPLGSQTHSFVAITEMGPVVLRFSRTSYKAAKSFLTTWTMSKKNLWAHPVVVTVQKQQKELQSGQRTNYFTMALAWMQQDRVPPAMQEAARALYAQVTQAHEQGRFSADDEQGDDDPRSRQQPRATPRAEPVDDTYHEQDDKGDIPF